MELRWGIMISLAGKAAFITEMRGIGAAAVKLFAQAEA